ncbi:transmembrane protein 134-like isoform X1 [Branchiostoma lanceolatum]|uniref:transmembrane protein 134-like isoform X1 n=1 Tax=Branchiostoma lanceolatum TaxID=7740 RepID=UPI00345122DB
MSRSKGFTIDDAFDLQVTSDDDEGGHQPGDEREHTPLKTGDPAVLSFREEHDNTRTGGEGGDFHYQGIEESEDDSLLEQPRAGFPISIRPRVQSEDSFISTSTHKSKLSLTRWYSHPKVQEHKAAVIASFLLLFIGIALIIVGIVLEVNVNRDIQPIVFIVIGAICFIPGVYHVVYIYCAIQGRPGFHFSSLPSFR